MTHAVGDRKTRLRLAPIRRAEILDAAIRLVIERGYSAATIEAIAEVAGASKATLYRHWVDKPTLIAAAAAERMDLDLDTIDSGTIVGDLRELNDMLVKKASQNIALVLALAAASQRDVQLRAALHSGLRPARTAIDALTAKAVERGEIKVDRAAYLSHLLIGALFTPVFVDGSDTGVTREYLDDYLTGVLIPFLGIAA